MAPSQLRANINTKIIKAYQLQKIMIFTGPKIEMLIFDLKIIAFTLRYSSNSKSWIDGIACFDVLKK
jgi:hypothetical protein